MKSPCLALPLRLRDASFSADVPDDFPLAEARFFTAFVLPSSGRLGLSMPARLNAGLLGQSLQKLLIAGAIVPPHHRPQWRHWLPTWQRPRPPFCPSAGHDSASTPTKHLSMSFHIYGHVREIVEWFGVSSSNRFEENGEGRASRPPARRCHVRNDALAKYPINSRPEIRARRQRWASILLRIKLST